MQIKASEKLSTKHFDEICEGAKVQAFSMQFSKPATNLCDAKQYAMVTKRNLVKSFGMQYSKGNWDRENPGWVTPLEI